MFSVESTFVFHHFIPPSSLACLNLASTHATNHGYILTECCELTLSISFHFADTLAAVLLGAIKRFHPPSKLS